MQVTTVGLDLAKNVFHVHGVTQDGTAAFSRSLRRGQMFGLFERLEPCLIGMEACGTSHCWARELSELGHVVKLIAPVYVKPYVKRGKSDAADAEAICEAVTRPTMRFVEVKSPEQQAILSLDRARDLVVRQRTQTINMLRCLLAEFGIVFAQGVGHAIGFAKRATQEQAPELPPAAQNVVIDLSEQLLALHGRVILAVLFAIATAASLAGLRSSRSANQGSNRSGALLICFMRDVMPMTIKRRM